MCGCAGLCICVLEPRISAFGGGGCSACCCCTCHVYITPSLKLSNSVLCGSHGATAVTHHHTLPFVTATDGESVCACACHVSYRNEHIISGEVQGCCEGGRAIEAHICFLGISKATAEPWVQQQQRCISSTTAPVLQPLALVRRWFCVHICVQCSPGDFSTCTQP